MEDAETFLASSVLNDGANISYRQLSRRLKVHANVAKQLLSKFHSSQNKRKSHSVTATYLVDGFLKTEFEQPVAPPKETNGDVHMQSSPFMSSAPQPEEREIIIPVRQISLVLEEHLENIRQRYAKIDSIHMYSLGPAAFKNLEILSDCNRILTKEYIAEDPLTHGKTYGVIHNAGVRRRTGTRPVNIAQPLPKPKLSVPQDVKSEIAGQGPTRSKAGPPSATPPALTGASKKTAVKHEGTKRKASDVFKSFATKPKPALESQDSAGSAQSAPKSQLSRAGEDVSMDDVSEDENPEDFIVSSKKSISKEKESRAERGEALRKMMDEDDNKADEKMTDAPPAERDSSAQESPDYEADPEEESESEFIDKTATKLATPEPEATVSSGRRRGRRKIMKKKTIKDEEGYLVTKEEPAWESFSEDEPAPTNTKKGLPASSMAALKAKKDGKKPGQGNITSFFGKR